MATKTEDGAPAAKVAGRKIRIASRIEGFRRGGIAHPAAPTDHDVTEFSVDELAAILAEPTLIVIEL